VSGARDYLGDLEKLIEEGNALRETSDATRREIFEMLAIPEVGVVTLSMDVDGLISAMAIDPVGRVGLTANQLVGEINMAILRFGGFAQPAIPRSPDADSDESHARGQALLSQVLAATSSGRVPEPQDIPNDFKTVTVTALWGNVTGVKCSVNWIDSSTDLLICEEIVRMARIAARQTDTLGRFSKQARS